MIDKAGLDAAIVIPANTPPSESDEAALHALLEERAVHGARVDRAALLALVRDAASDPAVEHRAVVARGTPPEHGRDGTLTLTNAIESLRRCIDRRTAALRSAGPDAQTNAEPPRATDEHGAAIDFYNLPSFVLVRSGDHVGTLTRPTPGVDGVSVLGATLPARPGRAAPVRLDDATSVEPDGRVVAARAGRLALSPDLLTIEPELDLNVPVSFATGNIDFPGPVRVRKGVQDRFRVRCDGPLIVDRLVGAATLDSAGDLSLLTGMAGREVGRIRVGGDCEAKYLDAVRGDVRGVLRVQREITACELSVLGGVESPRAVLRAGRLACAGRVVVGSIGSPSGTPTVLVLGGIEALASRARRAGDVATSLTSYRTRAARSLETLRRLPRPRPSGTIPPPTKAAQPPPPLAPEAKPSTCPTTPTSSPTRPSRRRSMCTFRWRPETPNDP